MNTFPQKIFRASKVIIHLFRGVRLTNKATLNTDGSPSDEFKKISQIWQKELCDKLNIKVTVTGKPNTEASLVVANHISWLDIPVLGGVTPLTFLSKSEVKEWPIIGKLAQQGGTLFIQRGGHGAAAQAANGIASKISKGNSVLIFPEGTTTDGSGVKRFFPRLLSAIEDSNSHVQPIALQYTDSNGKRSTAAPFIGDTSFLSHFWQILSQESLHVHVTFLEPIFLEEKSHRKAITLKLENSISGIVATETT